MLQLYIGGGVLAGLGLLLWLLVRAERAAASADAKAKQEVAENALKSEHDDQKRTQETHEVLAQIQREVAAMSDDAVRDKLRSKYPLPK